MYVFIEVFVGLNWVDAPLLLSIDWMDLHIVLTLLTLSRAYYVEEVIQLLAMTVASFILVFSVLTNSMIPRLFTSSLASSLSAPPSLEPLARMTTLLAIQRHW